jgi:hypothetical protein
MPNEYSNFTNPDSGSQSNPTGRPEGSTWDPKAKQWVVPNPNQRGSGLPGKLGNGYTSEGRVDTAADGAVENGSNVGGSWGGYNATVVRGDDGNLHVDHSMSGQAADVNRLQGLGAAASNRQAYQNDYTQANADAAMGAQMREEQGYAGGLMRNAALGIGSQSQALGRRMLESGAQAQQAAAMSTRGGGLAQAAAMRQQQNGQGAYMQAGNAELRGQLADEMARGRSAYMANSSAMRDGDSRAQALNQGQAINQMKNEMTQRDLNQQGQIGYESMAQNVNKAALDAQLKNREQSVGIDAAASARASRLADRDLNTTSSIVGGLGAATAAVAGSSPNKSGEDSERKKRDDENTWSDARTKRKVVSLGEAASRREGY